MQELFRKHYPKVLAFFAGWLFEVLTDLAAYLKALIEGFSR